MKCPKCKTGIMVPELDFDRQEVSKRCLICGERTYRDFVVHSATVRDADSGTIGAKPARGKGRIMTAEEREYVVAERAAGISCAAIARHLHCNTQLIWKIMHRMKPKTHTQEVSHA